MIKILLLFLLSFLFSCSSDRKDINGGKGDDLNSKIILNDTNAINNQRKNKYIDSISDFILRNRAISGDTLKYKFYIDDVGTEGNEGIAYYIDNRIVKLDFVIYTSMWEIHLNYLFKNNEIRIIEKTYNVYEKIKLEKKISYTVDLNGNPLQDVDKSRVDVFQEIKENVPLKLK